MRVRAAQIKSRLSKAEHLADVKQGETRHHSMQAIRSAKEYADLMKQISKFRVMLILKKVKQ